jgi:hypothetical protein
MVDKSSEVAPAVPQADGGAVPEDALRPRNNGGKTGRDTRFKPGNPGRPKGARHRVTVAVEVLLEGEAEALTRAAIEAALGGDMTALRLCLERIAPARREPLVRFDVPSLKTADDAPAALASLMEAVAAGELAPGEAATLAGVIEKWRGAYELTELERRLSVLEEENRP